MLEVGGVAGQDGVAVQRRIFVPELLTGDDQQIGFSQQPLLFHER